MSDEATFLIFNFTVDNSVEVIPIEWLADYGTKSWAYFPKAGTRGYKRLVKTRAMPLRNLFEKYDGRILRLFRK